MVEHFLGKEEVSGSSPDAGSRLPLYCRYGLAILNVVIVYVTVMLLLDTMFGIAW